MNTPAAGLREQLFWLFVLGIPVACISWTVTHEEVFREPREWFTKRSMHAASEYERKFFYLLTCEYCFSHYVAAALTALCKFRLLVPGWRGYFVAWLSLVWIANLYMSIFGHLRMEIKQERIEIAASENSPKLKRLRARSDDN
ncbi:MAG: hypothetical protein WAM58_04340 [Candidatus Acidiferrum sp.]